MLTHPNTSSSTKKSPMPCAPSYPQNQLESASSEVGQRALEVLRRLLQSGEGHFPHQGFLSRAEENLDLGLEGALEAPLREASESLPKVADLIPDLPNFPHRHRGSVTPSGGAERHPEQDFVKLEPGLLELDPLQRPQDLVAGLVPAITGEVAPGHVDLGENDMATGEERLDVDALQRLIGSIEAVVDEPERRIPRRSVTDRLQRLGGVSELVPDAKPAVGPYPVELGDERGSPRPDGLADGGHLSLAQLEPIPAGHGSGRPGSGVLSPP